MAKPTQDALVERLRTANQHQRQMTGDYMTFGQGQPLLAEAANFIESMIRDAKDRLEEAYKVGRDDGCVEGYGKARDEIADRITALSEQVARLEGERDFFKAEEENTQFYKLRYAKEMLEWKARAEAAEAQVARRTEALEKIKEGKFNCSRHQLYMAMQGVAERALRREE